MNPGCLCDQLAALSIVVLEHRSGQRAAGRWAMAHARLIQQRHPSADRSLGAFLVVLLGIVFYAVLIICAGVFFSYRAGLGLVFSIPLVVLVAGAGDHRSWPWER
jgi:hypothetical protein